MEKKYKKSIDEVLLNKISIYRNIKSDAYNIRKNGKVFERKTTDNINIITKKEKNGTDIFIAENALNETVHIPVIITESGLKDTVYNDFYIGKNAKGTIIAGCGIHNEHHEESEHSGIHRFYLEEGAHVKYIEKHYGQGNSVGKKIINPVTEIYMKKNSLMEMDSVQIKGVDFSIRKTKGELEENSNLVISEKIMTDKNQVAKTIFDVKLNGVNSSTHVISRSVATEDSKQFFESNIYGNSKCFARSECDAIIKDNAKVSAIPQIVANHVDASLIHEAAIGKIAGEQLIKLMTLGLSEKKAEEEIIKGFLK